MFALNDEDVSAHLLALRARADRLRDAYASVWRQYQDGELWGAAALVELGKILSALDATTAESIALTSIWAKFPSQVFATT